MSASKWQDHPSDDEDMSTYSFFSDIETLKQCKNKEVYKTDWKNAGIGDKVIYNGRTFSKGIGTQKEKLLKLLLCHVRSSRQGVKKRSIDRAKRSQGKKNPLEEYNEQSIKELRTYKEKWQNLSDGQPLKYMDITFTKGKKEDEELLLRTMVGNNNGSIRQKKKLKVNEVKTHSSENIIDSSTSSIPLFGLEEGKKGFVVLNDALQDRVAAAVDGAVVEEDLFNPSAIRLGTREGDNMLHPSNHGEEVHEPEDVPQTLLVVNKSHLVPPPKCTKIQTMIHEPGGARIDNNTPVTADPETNIREEPKNCHASIVASKGRGEERVEDGGGGGGGNGGGEAVGAVLAETAPETSVVAEKNDSVLKWVRRGKEMNHRFDTNHTNNESLAASEKGRDKEEERFSTKINYKSNHSKRYCLSTTSQSPRLTGLVEGSFDTNNTNNESLAASEKGRDKEEERFSTKINYKSNHSKRYCLSTTSQSPRLTGLVEGSGGRGGGGDEDSLLDEYCDDDDDIGGDEMFDADFSPTIRPQEKGRGGGRECDNGFNSNNTTINEAVAMVAVAAAAASSTLSTSTTAAAAATAANNSFKTGFKRLIDAALNIFSIKKRRVEKSEESRQSTCSNVKLLKSNGPSQFSTRSALASTCAQEISLALVSQLVSNEVNLDDDDDDDDDDGCLRRDGSSPHLGKTSTPGAASLMVPSEAMATNQSLGSASSAGMDVSTSTANNYASHEEEEVEVVVNKKYEKAASAESAAVVSASTAAALVPSFLFNTPECLQVANKESTLGTAVSGAGMSASISAAKNDDHIVVNNEEYRGARGFIDDYSPLQAQEKGGGGDRKFDNGFDSKDTANDLFEKGHEGGENVGLAVSDSCGKGVECREGVFKTGCKRLIDAALVIFFSNKKRCVDINVESKQKIHSQTKEVKDNDPLLFFKASKSASSLAVGTSLALASPSASIESNLGNDDGSMRREMRMVSTSQPFETASLIVAIAAMTAMLPKQPSKIAAALNAGVDMTSSFADNDDMGMTLFGDLSIADMGMNIISTANNDDTGMRLFGDLSIAEMVTNTSTATNGDDDTGSDDGKGKNDEGMTLFGDSSIAEMDTNTSTATNGDNNTGRDDDKGTNKEGMTLFDDSSIVEMDTNISTANNDDIGSDDDKAGLALLAAAAAVSSPIVVFDERRGGRESCNTVESTLTSEAGQDECRDDSAARSESFTIAALAGVGEGGKVCCGTVASEIRIEGEECGNSISTSRRNSSTVCGVKLSTVKEKNIAGSIKVSEWDVILNDPLTHSSTHPGTKAFGEFIREHMSCFKYYKMDKKSKHEFEDSIINSLIEYVRNNGRFLMKQSMKYTVAKDDEVILNIRSWFNIMKDENVPVFGCRSVDNFLEHNQGLNAKIIEFLDDLYLSEYREPWTPGPGLCGSVDAPFHKNQQMNFHRPAYIRQTFSRDHPTEKTGDVNTVYRWTYGTGCGLATHGIPKCHLVFRAFPDSLTCIADSVEMYLRQHLDDKSIKIFPFTTAVVVTYMDGKIIQSHCDQVYSPDGEFRESQNSQTRDSPTVTLVIGDPRDLSFDLCCYEGTKQKTLLNWGKIPLKHGSLFILDPSIEIPAIRPGLEEHGRTFFKHSCNGVSKKENKMSIGIVFRATSHLAEVHRDTGLVVLDENLDLKMLGMKEKKDEKKTKTKKDIAKERKMFQERDEFLVDYFKGKVHPMDSKSKDNQKKEIDEPKSRRLWEKCRDTYFTKS